MASYNPWFDTLMEMYGIFDIAIHLDNRLSGLYSGYYRYRRYNDGNRLEGYDLEPVIYWSA